MAGQSSLHRLTHLQLRGLIKAASRDNRAVSVSDGGGLTLTVSKKGYAAWVLRYRFRGKQRELTLRLSAEGRDYGLRQARETAQDLRGRIKQGEDVAASKRRDRAVSSTVKGLANDWYRRTVESVLEHPGVIRRILDKDIIPVLGDLDPADVQPRHIDAMLRRTVERGAPTIANDALRIVKRLFAYARKRHIVEHSPAADFDQSDAGGRETPRKRALSRVELAELFKSMRQTPNLGRPNELAFKVLLATCVRKVELIGARWPEFDLEEGVWDLPAERTKTRAPLAIPLAPIVVEWLQELKVLACGSEYVLPTRNSSKRFPHISPDTVNVALKRVNHGLQDFTIHDMRRTARTLLAELGVADEIAERALNHKTRGVAGIYNRHHYFTERREALETWAALLDALDRGEDFNVIPLRR